MPHDQKPSPDEIRREIAARREAITQHIEDLESRIEKRIKSTIDEAASRVEHASTEVTGRIEQTIERLGHTRDEALDKARGSIKELTEKTKASVDLRRHAEERPWLTVAASLAAGVALGSLVGEGRPVNGRSLQTVGRKVGRAGANVARSAAFVAKEAATEATRTITEAAGYDGETGSRAAKAALVSLATSLAADWTYRNLPELSPVLESITRAMTESDRV